MTIKSLSSRGRPKLIPYYLLLITSKTPPSDEGGVFLRSEKTEGENRITLQIIFLSLSQNLAVLPAPSSEGALFALKSAFFDTL